MAVSGQSQETVGGQRLEAPLPVTGQTRGESPARQPRVWLSLPLGPGAPGALSEHEACLPRSPELLRRQPGPPHPQPEVSSCGPGSSLGNEVTVVSTGTLEAAWTMSYSLPHHSWLVTLNLSLLVCI